MSIYGKSAQILKPLDEVGLADPRFKIMALRQGDSWRPFELADLHQRVEILTLNAGVPVDVRRNFEIAKNLLLYTWFVYEFQRPAAQQAFSTLEMALRLRFPDAVKKSLNKDGTEKTVAQTLRPLLERARKEGLLNLADLPFCQRIRAYREANPFDSLGRPMQWKPDGEWLEGLLSSVAFFRNNFSHGSNMLSLGAIFDQVSLCGDLINAVFPYKADCKSTDQSVDFHQSTLNS